MSLALEPRLGTWAGPFTGHDCPSAFAASDRAHTRGVQSHSAALLGLPTFGAGEEEGTRLDKASPSPLTPTSDSLILLLPVSPYNGGKGRVSLQELAPWFLFRPFVHLKDKVVGVATVPSESAEHIVQLFRISFA